MKKEVEGRKKGKEEDGGGGRGERNSYVMIIISALRYSI